EGPRSGAVPEGTVGRLPLREPGGGREGRVEAVGRRCGGGLQVPGEGLQDGGVEKPSREESDRPRCGGRGRRQGAEAGREGRREEGEGGSQGGREGSEGAGGAGRDRGGPGLGLASTIEPLRPLLRASGVEKRF